MAEGTPVREDAAATFARLIAGASHADLPADAVESTKKCMLDALGVILGASGAVADSRALAELVLDAGGKPESTVIGFGGKVPAWMAALANGGMGHSLDYDDIHTLVVVHPSACVVPAAFAMAERIGNVSGRELLTAVAYGIDMTSRLGLAIDWKEDWHLSPVFGTFGCAAAAGKLLKLDSTRMIDAFGIALSQAGCTMELNVGVGSNLRGAYPGFAAKAGVLSACMAHKGITGPKNSLEGQCGLFAVHFRNEYRREALFEDLGRRFESTRIRFKPWPACTITQAYIEATIGLCEAHDIRPEDVRHVKAYIGDFGVPLCEPLAGRRQPATTLDAKFSIPFTVAAAIARRNVVIADYTEEGLHNPVVLALAARVTPVLCADMKKYADIYPADIEIETVKGTYRRKVDEPYGHPKKPMSLQSLTDKFRDCAAYSATPLGQAKIETAIAQISGIEKLDDAGAVMRSLC